jgi:hypothetical protein
MSALSGESPDAESQDDMMADKRTEPSLAQYRQACQCRKPGSIMVRSAQ